MINSGLKTDAYALVQGRIFTGETFLDGHALLVEKDRIVTLLPERDMVPGIECIDTGGAVITPGFIDLQVNGCGGVMFNDAVSVETLERMHASNRKSGCTSFLPTLVTSSDADMHSAMGAVAEYRARDGAASVLGLHLEGPYINPIRKGIHNAAYIRQLQPVMRDALCAFAKKIPLLLTLAPECVDTEDIRTLARAGVIVSVGHSAATYEEAKLGMTAGIRTATHLFNAMSPWQSREPGVVGAVLEEESISCGLIVDGLHSHYTSVILAKRLKHERCYLVTDGTAASGSGIEEFNFCGRKVYVKDGKCLDKNGTLGGSSLTMIRAVRNCVRNAGIPVEESMRMASLYPARLLGLEQYVGRFEPGAYANCVLFDPDNFSVRATVDRGKLYVWEGQG